LDSFEEKILELQRKKDELIQELENKKSEAIDNEDFMLAHQLKLKIQELKG